MTYLFVGAQLKTPAMTAPLSHGKQIEEAHTSHARPAAPPTPQGLSSCIHYVRWRRGESVAASRGLPKKETMHEQDKVWHRCEIRTSAAFYVSNSVDLGLFRFGLSRYPCSLSRTQIQ